MQKTPTMYDGVFCVLKTFSLCVENIFISFAELDGGSLARTDNDFLFRLGVYAFSLALFFQFESGKAGDVNVFSFLKAIGKGIYHSVEAAFRFFDGNALLVCKLSDKFALVHYNSSRIFLIFFKSYIHYNRY